MTSESAINFAQRVLAGAREQRLRLEACLVEAHAAEQEAEKALQRLQAVEASGDPLAHTRVWLDQNLLPEDTSSGGVQPQSINGG